jgi:hypothetical protein
MLSRLCIDIGCSIFQKKCRSALWLIKYKKKSKINQWSAYSVWQLAITTNCWFSLKLKNFCSSHSRLWQETIKAYWSCMLLCDMSFFLKHRGYGNPSAEFKDPDWNDTVNFGIGLLYRPARLHGLAGWYDNPMPESTLSPSQGSMNSATGILKTTK